MLVIVKVVCSKAVAVVESSSDTNVFVKGEEDAIQASLCVKHRVRRDERKVELSIRRRIGRRVPD